MGATINESDAVLEEDGRTSHGYKGGSHAPSIASPSRILDVETGTGMWAIEYATENPDATIIGTDLNMISARNASLLLLSYSSREPHYMTITGPPASPSSRMTRKEDDDDRNQPLPLLHRPRPAPSSTPFDYIHLHSIFLDFQNISMRVLRQVFARTCAPGGGWFEYVCQGPVGAGSIATTAAERGRRFGAVNGGLGL
ncbi:S-adenosyl-L-methionine-dependent methyltransferase [Apiospora phragmitis]|uniref:S-adenosyl-L-methionine-dependent methyltransferase n=1 Tax=Apiospora phragmitis TaxID=2905665 RepID=A0ABR1VID0_9PEZI